jgi:hypothetical protein
LCFLMDVPAHDTGVALGCGRSVPSGMRLHTSPEPIARVSSVDQDAVPSHKPGGLWWAEGTAWLEFCAYNYQQKLHRNHYEVELAPGANVLRLATRAEIADFSAAFGTPPEPGFGQYGPKQVRAIHWDQVAEQYSGIEVSDPRGEARWEDYWLDKWDVPSGCVWHAEAVRELVPVEVRIEPAGEESWQVPRIGEVIHPRTARRR